MQTSTMMLDSTSGKILTDKQIDLPLHNDPEAADNSSATSEAEVRLVVKFIVEEHIVYEGKVERVNQLESEELSRVVSRVAWASAKEAGKSTLEGEDDKAEEKASDEAEKSDQPSFDAAADESTGSQSRNASSPPDKKTEQVQEEVINKSLDHMAYIQPPSKLIQEEELANEEVSVAQLDGLHVVESTTNTDCDITLKQTLNHICQANHLEPSNSPRVLESDKDDLEEKVAISNEYESNIDVIQEPKLIEDTFKSISETLNDCVNNVDRESRKEALDILEVARTQTEELSNPVNSDYPTLNGLKETCENIGSADFQVSKDNVLAVDEELNHKRKVATVVDNHLIDDTKSLNQPKSIDNLSVSTNHPPKVDNQTSSNKRKAIGEHKSSGKRIRRAVPKDWRNSNTKTGTSKTSGNASNRHRDASSGTKPPATVSLLESNQHVHLIKIFARWSDNFFYPGTILKRTKDRKFVIGFYDGAQRNVAEADLIPLSNIEGKQVRVTIAKDYCVAAVVHHQHLPVDDQPMFEVEYQQDGMVKKCVPFKDIFLTCEQGTPLISQADRNSGASNFADVDLDNIIYEKRSRRLQEMEDFELTESPSINGKRKRGQYNTRNITPRPKANSVDCLSNPVNQNQKRHSQNDFNQEPEGAESPDVLKTNFLCPNSNPPSESSSSTGSSNEPKTLDLGQEFYFTSSSPHRTKTSLLL